MRKIIIGSESFFPNISGVATTTQVLAKNLAKQGWQVFVFAPSQFFKTFEDSNFREYKVIRFRSIPNPLRKGFRFSAFAKSQIIKKVAEIQPDIIHLQDPTSICSALLKAGQRFKIPVVITNHFYLDYIISYLGFLKIFKKQIRIILRRHLANFYNQCQYIICPTESVKKELFKWGVKRPVAAISNVVDLSRFYAHENLGNFYLKYHLPNNPLVLYFGRVDKDKEVTVLIKAVPLVLKEIEAHFMIGGAGDELEKLKNLAQGLGLEGKISWLGWIKHESEDLPKIYQAAKVFVIPNRHETQSIVTLEAMAAGLPIVAANSGALPELVQNNQNGYLFYPGDEKDLASKIVSLLKDEQKRKKMAEKSLEVSSSHQIQQNLAKIKRIYEIALEAC